MLSQSCTRSWGEFFVALGTGEDVPRPLRANGKVYNRYGNQDGLTEAAVCMSMFMALAACSLQLLEPCAVFAPPYTPLSFLLVARL